MANGDEQMTQINWLQELARDYLKERKQRRRMRFIWKSMLFLIIMLSVFFSFVKPETDTLNKPHIAAIDIEGGIFAKTKADADHFVDALVRAFRNRQAKAIVIDINSPGGSPVQADEMYRALTQLRKQFPSKKVYAFCGDMCTSAAYYVAAGADEIYANPASLVGSIGVLFNGFGAVDALHKLGITRRLVTAGRYKGFMDPFTPEDPAAKEKLHTMLGIVHQQFKESVIQGRGKRLHSSDEIFSGLFWTGVQAKKLGLIDGFSSSREFVAVQFQGMTKHNYTRTEGLIDRLSEQLGASVAHRLTSWLGLPASPLA